MGKRKCGKCFRHEKKTILYQGHACPYRPCNCNGCHPKRKTDFSKVKRGRPSVTTAPYQLPLMAGVQLPEQARPFARVGMHTAKPLPTSTSISSTNFSGVSSGQVPPVIGARPVTSQAFILVNNTKNTSKCHTYRERVPITHRKVLAQLHQNKILSLDPRRSPVSYLPASNQLETKSKSQIQIQQKSNINMDSRASRQPIQTPFSAQRLPSVTNVPTASSSSRYVSYATSTDVQSTRPSNTVPRGSYPRPVYSMFRSTKNSNSLTNSVGILPATYTSIMGTSQFLSSQNQNRLSCYVNYNHPMKNDSKGCTFKNPMQVHQTTSTVIHFSEQSNSKTTSTELSPPSSESTISAFSCTSPLLKRSESLHWSQTHLANNSISKLELQNFKREFNSDLEHATINETETPLKMLSLVTCSPLMTPPPPLIKKPTNNLSYHVACNSSKQNAAVLDNLENNCKFPSQVQQANSIIKTANYTQVSEHKTSSVETFPSISSSSSLSSMTSPVLKISENVSSSLSCRDSLVENTETLIYSDSSSQTDQSEITPIQMKDGSIPKISIKDSSATIPSPAGYLEYGLGKTSSEQQNASADLEMDTTIPKIDLDNKEGEYCQESGLDNEAEKIMADVLSLETEALSDGEKELKFFVLQHSLYVLQTMFPGLPFEILYPIYMARKCDFFRIVQDLLLIERTNHISQDLMEICQLYSKEFIDRAQVKNC